jgi:hypothetical protein
LLRNPFGAVSSKVLPRAIENAHLQDMFIFHTRSFLMFRKLCRDPHSQLSCRIRISVRLFEYIVDLGLARALLPNLDPFCVALAHCCLYYGSLTSIPVCNACTSSLPGRDIGVLTLLAHTNTADNRTCSMIMFAFSNLRPRRYPSSTDDRSYLQSARVSANRSKGDAMNVLVF